MLRSLTNHFKSIQFGRREGALLAACLILLSVILPTLTALTQMRRYVVSGSTQALVGNSNQAFAKQVKFDAKEQTYTLNADAAAGNQDNPAAKLASMQATVGASSDADKAPYGLKLHRDFSQGMTMTDSNTGLSFDIIPQFKAMNGLLEDGRLVYPIDGGQQAIYSIKGNGLKEDIVLPVSQGNEGEWKYQLKLPSTLQARIQADGSVGIFSADPTLFGNISFGSDADQAKVQSAREHAVKNHLVFAIPAPTIKQAGGGGNSAKGWFTLGGNDLTVHASGLAKLHYPISVDPSVVVTSTSDFQMGGNNEGLISYAPSVTPAVAGGALETWSPTTTFSTGRYNHAAVAANGYIYVLGGYDGSALSDVQYAPINSTTGTVGAWQPTTSLPTGLYDFQTAISNGYIYTFGGYTGTTYVSDVQYAPINSTTGTIGAWQPTTSLPTGRGSSGVVVANGYAYVAGGTDAVSTFSDVQYAPINSTTGTIGAWQPATSLRTTSSDLELGFYNGYIYAVEGGSTGDTEYASVNATTGAIGTWNITSGTGRDNGSSVVYNGYLYVMDGTGSNGNLTSLSYAPLDPSTGAIGQWNSTNNATGARIHHQTIAYNGYMYLLGGQDGSAAATNDVQFAKIDTAKPSGTSEQITRGAVSNGTVGAWTNSTNTFATQRESGVSVAYNGYLYIMGGWDGANARYNDVQYAPLDAATGAVGTWKSTTSFTTARNFHSGTVYNGYMYIMAGTNNGSVDLTDIQYAKVKSDGTLGSWVTNATQLPRGKEMPGVVAYNGYLYALGGYTDTPVSDTNDVLYAPIHADGSVGAWTNSANKFSGVREASAAVAYNGYIYIMGGYSSAIANDVQYAPLNADGSTGAWKTTSSFTKARDYLSAVVYNGYMYIMGGYDGSVDLNDVQYAPIYANGSVGAWNTTIPFASVRNSTATVAYNGYIYLMGGVSSTQTSQLILYNDTQYTKIDTGSTGPPPPSGPVNFGKTAAGASTDTGQYNHLTCSQYVSPNFAGTVTSMSINVGAVDTSKGSSQTYATAVYDTSGSGGGPGALVGSSGTGSTVTGWNTITMNVTVAASTTYWLCWENKSSRSYDTGNVTYDTGSANAGASSTGTMALGTWTSNPAMTFTTKSYAVYATVTPPAGAANTLGTTGSWTTTTSLSSARQAHSSVVYNGYVYAIGGTRAGVQLNDIIYAKINADGTLGAWNPTTSFPIARSGHTSIVNNGYLYVIGGNDGTTDLNDVEYAPLDPVTGAVGAWKNTTSFTTPRQDHTSVVYNGYVYVIGGYSGTTPYSDVQYAPLDPVTGAVGAWKWTASFTTARSGHTSVVYNGYVYVIGGYQGSGVVLNDVQYAPLDPVTGAVGAWKSTTSFTTARQEHTSVVYNGYVYIIGGAVAPSSSLSDVQYAKINTDGTLGDWVATSSFTTSRQGHTSVVYNGYVYLMGGLNGTEGVDVQDAPVNSIALTGHYSKLIDLGAPMNITGITYNGKLPGGGGAMISYKAAGTDGIFTNSASPNNITSPSACSSNLSGVRYLLITVTLDDSGFYPESSLSTPANVTDLTVNYSPGHPAPNVRLRLGQTLQNGTLSALDTCTP